MEQIKEFADRYLTQIQFIGPMDIVEIILISLMVYYLLIFIRNTRAWQLLKGVFVILVFLVIAEILQMDTILWIARTAFQFATIALIVVLQPELRKALEQLGQKNLIRSVIPFESSKPEEGLFSDRTIREIVKGCVEMSRAKTGALIVVRQLDSLAEYERTGIAVDGIVTSQLLINIFEKNTPLHDGAVIVQGNRVTYATCYLPLSDNMRLSKDLGTRHRAGVGISEVTDSMTVIVSEENGKISVAYEGTLSRGLTAEELEQCAVIRRELGTHFCRRCGYCAPCPNGIDIPSNFLMANYARKYGLAGWAEQRYKAMPYHAGSCVMCGACEKRCPYGLPIRDMLEGVAKVFGY